MRREGDGVEGSRIVVSRSLSYWMRYYGRCICGSMCLPYALFFYCLFPILSSIIALSQSSVSLFITNILLNCATIALVYSIHDSTEVAIQKMIDASQTLITLSSQGETGGMSPPQKRHLELQIKKLENAPRYRQVRGF